MLRACLHMGSIHILVRDALDLVLTALPTAIGLESRVYSTWIEPGPLTTAGIVMVTFARLQRL